MSIANVGSVVATQAVGSGTGTPGPTAASKFGEALAKAASPATQGAGGQVAQAAVQPAKTQQVDVVAKLAGDQKRMDEVLALAQSGKSFSPAELLSLQTQVYRSSQQLDLAGKVVEKTTGGVKQVLQTQL
jgi:hypothetical protein